MIKVGDRLPEGAVKEFIEVETPGCPLGPNEFKVQDLARGKKIVIFGLPGAFTPTCSAKHVPGYLENFNALKGKGVDEIWCLSVNDPWVMGAWGRDQKAVGKIRFLADGAGVYTKALGMDREIPGMGLRSCWLRPLPRLPTSLYVSGAPGSPLPTTHATGLPRRPVAAPWSGRAPRRGHRSPNRRRSSSSTSTTRRIRRSERLRGTLATSLWSGRDEPACLAC